jgi:hypothetical protein
VRVRPFSAIPPLLVPDHVAPLAQQLLRLGANVALLARRLLEARDDDLCRKGEWRGGGGVAIKISLQAQSNAI